MKIELAKEICREKLALLRNEFEQAGVKAIEEVEVARYEAIGTEPSDRLVVSLAVSVENDENKVLYLSEEVAFLTDPEEAEENFTEALEVFAKECCGYAERIKNAEDKSAVIDEINEELYGRLVEETANAEKSINKNLYTALAAVGLVALCAILSIIMELLF